MVIGNQELAQDSSKNSFDNRGTSRSRGFMSKRTSE
jgi:hypothetical protein